MHHLSARTVRMLALRRALSSATKKPKKEVMVGGYFEIHGQQEDPMFNTLDGVPKGDPEGYLTYRAPPTKPFPTTERRTFWMSAVFWAWITYRLYYNYGELFGEYHMPELYEFTDAELGIPPDEFPDPEYWGEHPYKSSNPFWRFK